MEKKQRIGLTGDATMVSPHDVDAGVQPYRHPGFFAKFANSIMIHRIDVLAHRLQTADTIRPQPLPAFLYRTGPFIVFQPAFFFVEGTTRSVTGSLSDGTPT